ncbi:MAG: DUF6544 family protein [Candidatus Velthaea sp.]
MKRWLLIRVAVMASIAGGVAAAFFVAHLRWNRATARSVVRLHEQRQNIAARFSRDDLAGLPAPVIRYFEFALTPGQSVVRNARLQQRGEFAMRAGSWSPFTAVEHFSVEPPGFLWDARIRMAAIMPLYVRDGYVANEGAMYGTLAAMVPLVNQCGTPVMASGELLRYLAEAVLFPTALLPRGGISWSSLPGNTARVTLADGQTTVSCDVEFGERGEIARISALRYRDGAGKSGLTPWVGRWSDYHQVAGMMIPMVGQVEWVLPEGPFPYWRGRIVNAQYEFAP